ncbi:MAG: D-alanyl-D-alanine carboxypeptidase/D-alanyl-D-alanine-endopeptidase [Alphaproteobacteria bacterium]
MTFKASPLLAALVLIPILSACSSAVRPAPETAAVAQESRLAPAPSTLTPDPPELALDAAAVEPAAAPAGEEPPVARVLRPMLAIDDDPAQPLPDILPDGAEVSYVVLDLARGTTIAGRQAGRSHIPASSAKLATAVAALELLGPEHRFRTELRVNGPIVDGVLEGDLILVGGGDPLLDIPDLLPLIERLVRKGVSRIDGRFLIDDGALPRFTEIEPSQPTEAAYNPGVGALSLAFNRVNLRWNRPGALEAETVPELDEASFETAAADRLPPGGVQLKSLAGGHAVWQLADKGARRSAGSLPVKDPGLHAGRVFQGLAALYGITLPAPARLSGPADGELLALHESPPLRELVRDMLWYSNNLMAELIGLSAARTLAPVAELGSSADVMLAALRARMPEVSWEGAHLENHSGLSSKARLSPAQLAAILRHGWEDGMLSSLLPGSGWSGTLARRFNGPDQALRIWAKTGSINYVATLGGYLLSAEHAPAAFVIMISDEAARAAYEAAPRRTRAGETQAHQWHRAAERAMDQIVERWLQPGDGEQPDGLIALSMRQATDGR